MDSHASATIEPQPPAPAQEPVERVLTWGDLARYAKTGCRRCFGAGSIVIRGAGTGERDEPRVPVARTGGGSPWDEKKPERLRCACTDRGLDRAGLVLVSTPRGVVARKAA